MEIRIEELEILEATEEDKEEWAVILEPGIYYIGVVFDDTRGYEEPREILRTAPKQSREEAETAADEYEKDWWLTRRIIDQYTEMRLTDTWEKYHPKLVGKTYYGHRTYGPRQIDDEGK